ncbi:FIMAH domain-containing protein [Virgibacillus dakarensis]
MRNPSVEQYEEDEFSNDTIAQVLKLHMKTVKHFEDQEKARKFVKHGNVD